MPSGMNTGGSNIVFLRQSHGDALGWRSNYGLLDNQTFPTDYLELWPAAHLTRWYQHKRVLAEKIRSNVIAIGNNHAAPSQTPGAGSNVTA